jgi:ring-1,2-phenylacetyl-CoA epoxidase subunit PaaE
MQALRKEIRIKTIIPETKNCKTFVLESTDDNSIIYKPGQFLTFIFNGVSGEERRSYSLSSTPALNEPLSITVKRIPNGFYSRKLVDEAGAGDLLTTIGANGFFTLPADTTKYRQLFLLAAGSGISPVYSILKTALQNFPGLRIVLIYSNRSREDAIFYNALRQLETSYHGRLQIEWLFSDAFDHTRSRLGNWLLSELLKKYVDAPLTQCLFYLCGPLSYMRTIMITLLIAGVDRANIRKEEFVITQPLIELKPPDTTPREISVVLDEKRYQFAQVYPQTILQSAKLAGVELPYSCEIGKCGTCAAVCTNGNVWMKYNEVLTDEDLQTKKILTCTGYAVYGDVDLDFDAI